MYQSDQIAERCKIIAKKNGVTMKDVLARCELAKGTMINFKTSFPKTDTLAKIADELGCSMDFLMGRTENPGINK